MSEPCRIDAYYGWCEAHETNLDDAGRCPAAPVCEAPSREPAPCPACARLRAERDALVDLIRRADRMAWRVSSSETYAVDQRLWWQLIAAAGVAVHPDAARRAGGDAP